MSEAYYTIRDPAHDPTLDGALLFGQLGVIEGAWMRIADCPIWNVMIRGTGAPIGRVEFSMDGQSSDGIVIPVPVVNDPIANIQTDMPVPFVRYVLTAGGQLDRVYFYGCNR